jgi:hypothetical protein
MECFILVGVERKKTNGWIQSLLKRTHDRHYWCRIQLHALTQEFLDCDRPAQRTARKATPVQAWTGPWGSRRLRFPEFVDNRHIKVVRLAALRTGCLVSHFVRGWVDPRTLMRPKGLSQWKIPIAPTGIEPATFRLVPQCLNQLQYRVRLRMSRFKDKLQITCDTRDLKSP